MSNLAKAAIVVLIFACGMIAGGVVDVWGNIHHIKVSWCSDDY
jgi:hypothetical protein